MTRDFDVRLATPDDRPAVGEALAQAYGRPFATTFLAWKHDESPWGPSACHIAVDDGGLLGVVFFQRWPLTIDGVPLSGFRQVDGATTPRAQRRGVFRAIGESMLATAAAPSLVFATATPEACAAHVKNGATTLAPITSWVVPVVPRPARLTGGGAQDAVLGTWVAPAQGIATAWDTPALRWRIDPRSGWRYHTVALADADQPHGLIYRVVGRGVRRAIAVVASWGPRPLVERALGAAAWQARVAVAFRYEPLPAGALHRRMRRPSGQSLMCVWDVGSGDRAPYEVSRWRSDGLDLEGVI